MDPLDCLEYGYQTRNVLVFDVATSVGSPSRPGSLGCVLSRRPLPSVHLGSLSPPLQFSTLFVT